MHHWAETGEEDPEWADPRDIDLLQRKLLSTGVRRSDYWVDGEHEVTYALQLFTLELLMPKPNEDRDAWKKQWPADKYLTGTIDWVHSRGDSHWLDDLKTGRWPVDPRNNPQLRSYTLFDWVKWGCPAGADWTVSITQWPKYRLDERPKRTFAVVTSLELEEHLDNLRYSVSHPTEINPGDEQCKFCDSRPLCPAWHLG